MAKHIIQLRFEYETNGTWSKSGLAEAIYHAARFVNEETQLNGETVDARSATLVGWGFGPGESFREGS